MNQEDAKLRQDPATAPSLNKKETAPATATDEEGSVIYQEPPTTISNENNMFIQGNSYHMDSEPKTINYVNSLKRENRALR